MPDLDAIRIGNVVTDLAFLQTGQPFVPPYVANGWLGGCCDEFGFHARPQYDMDHGRTGLCHQLHYVRRPWGGHDLAQLAHLQATYADGRRLGLAALGGYRQVLDLATATLTTAWSAGGAAWNVRHYCSWAVPQLCEWRCEQSAVARGDLLVLHLRFDTAAADNNAKHDPTLHTAPPRLTIDLLGDSMARVVSATNCRTTTLLVQGEGLRLAADGDGLRLTTAAGVSVLRLLVLDERLDPAIARDPYTWLATATPAEDHAAAVAARWQQGVLLLPPGPPAQVWLRSRYYAIASLPPWPCHIQDTTGLCNNIWGHGFPQDQWFVVAALPRLGLADLARAQMPVWADRLPEVQRYTRRLAGVEGAFYPWVPPFEKWDEFEADGPLNADSFEFHNSAYVAAMAWSIFQATGDRAGLTRHLPLLREIARFYAAISELPENGGARIIHPEARPQDEAMPADQRSDHPLCCVWSATWAMRAWLAAREALGADDDAGLAGLCRAILGRGYDLDALRRPGGGLRACANDPRPPGRQKHPVQLNPLSILPLPDLMEDRDVQWSWRHRLDLCSDSREPRSHGWTFALLALASARMRDGDALAADLALVQPARYADGRWIQFYESSCRNGWQHKKAYYFTASGLYLQALTDAVVQDCRGHIDLCAALLPEWRTARLEVRGVSTLGGARIDGWYESGRCRFTITPVSDGQVAVRLGLPGPWRLDGALAAGGTVVRTPGRAGVALVVER